MALRPATQEEINTIRGSQPVSPGMQSPVNSTTPTYSKLRVVSAGTPQGQQSALPKSEIRGGVIGNLLTGSTQRFGRTIGESLAAPKSSEMYGTALQQYTEGTNLYRNKINELKKLGQDPSRYEELLSNQLASSPKIDDFTGNVINKKPGQVIGEGIGTGLEMLSGGLLSGGAKTLSSKTLSGLEKVKQGAKIGGAYGAIGGGSGAMQEGRGVGGVAVGTIAGSVLGGALGGAIPLIGIAGSKVATGLKNLATPKNIMNRVARLNPSDAVKFQRMTGKSHGQYLTETGNFGSPEEIITKEYNKFIQSKLSVDDELAKLPGVYKSKPLSVALNELVEREGRMSLPGKETGLINNLSQKANSVGLTNKEINIVKRLYERNVRLDYLRQNLPEKVESANRVDSALREWQFELADRLGFKNLPELNKQTQASKFIVDKLGKQLEGKVGNDAVNLTDWIVLQGGTPESVAALGIKKFFSNKGIQAKIAKALSGTPKGIIKPNIGPSKVLQLPAPKAGAPKSSNNVPIKLGPLSQSSIDKREQLVIKESLDKLKKLTSPIKDIPNKSGGFIQAYKGEKDLTTKILKDLEGKTTVSKQYILDATNRGELKQVERDLIRQMLADEPTTVNVPNFAKKVKAELLPLERYQSGNVTAHGTNVDARYEHITLPAEIRGKIQNYDENIYQSPIKTSAGGIHFDKSEAKNYFGHTRIEDMADNKTRRVIEVQSDLYQKGNLDREALNMRGLTDADAKKYLTDSEFKELKGLKDKYSSSNTVDQNLALERRQMQLVEKIEKNHPRTKEVAKLSQYNDPTAHFRMVREEIKKAAQDGKTKLQFPTGETAMKIEGLGSGEVRWTFDNQGPATPAELKVGKEIWESDPQMGMLNEDAPWIITDILGDGKFKAVPKEYYEKVSKNFGKGWQEVIKNAVQNESFDISGKVDTSNPIYRFYEKDVQKYLNKFGGKRVVDENGVSWIEVPIKKEWGKMPVEAFGKIAGSPLFTGAGIGLAGVSIAGRVKNQKER